jgi:hypothetical protein
VEQELLEFLIGIRRKEKTVKQTTQSGMAPLYKVRERESPPLSSLHDRFSWLWCW